jgi:DNA mismatch repair protein MutS2
MNEHALAVLEFPAVLAVIASRASSALGAQHVRSLAPTDGWGWIESEHARVATMRSLTGGDSPWHPEPIPDVATSLERLRVAGSVWSPHELLAGGTLLRSSRRTREQLAAERRDAMAAAVLAPLLDSLVSARQQETAIERAVDPDGLVRDAASPELRRLRRELRGAQGELVQLLERVMARLESHHRVADMSVTVRNGRYVIPVRREGRGAVGGIVHDESATRGTVFVEPPAAIEAGNRIRELEAEEAREIHRVLRELTDELRPIGDSMAASLESLVELDSLYARARYADEFACAPPILVSGAEGCALHNGRHPLLLARGGVVVPFDLELAPGERTLLISGPNTGGKTVLLKAIGLVSAMVQAGIPAPVGEGSRVAVYDNFFADIGDEQSIQASLSTFSAHLKNLGEILEAATARSLVLMDELGAGTDPVEGAALGWAILEELTGRGATSVATTHLGALKLLASERPGVVNASLQFDEQALAPTYRLIKGIPGRSYGLSIAKRLRLPAAVLSRAAERVPQGERDVAALLADLERREAALSEAEQRVAAHTERAERRLTEVEQRERTARAAERALERREREAARRYLLEARTEVERAIREVKSSESDSDTARSARRRIEALVEEQGRALAAVEAEEAAETDNEIDEAASELAIGDAVTVDTLGGRLGRVLELRGDAALVVVGAMKVTVPATALRRTTRRPVRAEESVTIRGALPEAEVTREIDLRGMRADEIDGVVMHALDSAIRAELPSLRIIHGKGTGALRQRVADMLRADARVKSYRLAGWNEGGAGVTVAELA